MNHTGIVGTLLDCQTTGIVHSVDKTETDSWVVSLSIPWDLIHTVSICDFTTEAGRNQELVTPNPYAGAPSSVYRANFYRVNELIPTSACNSSTCEYMAWSPTYQSPPAFHEPTFFGVLYLS